MFGKHKRVVQILGIIVIHLKGQISADKSSQTGGLLVPHVAELAKYWALGPPQSQACPGTGVSPKSTLGLLLVLPVAGGLKGVIWQRGNAKGQVH